MISIGLTLHSLCLTSTTVRCSRKCMMPVTCCETSSRTNDNLPAAGDVCAFLLCLCCYCEYHASFCTDVILEQCVPRGMGAGHSGSVKQTLLNANSAKQTSRELRIALLCKALLHVPSKVMYDSSTCAQKNSLITPHELWMGKRSGPPWPLTAERALFITTSQAVATQISNAEQPSATILNYALQ